MRLRVASGLLSDVTRVLMRGFGWVRTWELAQRMLYL
jgi:hypothetical protein